MRNKNFLVLIVFFLTVAFVTGGFFLINVMPVDALDLTEELGKAGKAAYGSEDTKPLAETVGSIIQTALTFLGTIALILVLYGGFLWMTAGGNEEQVKKAKDILKNGVIGLIIIVSAYAITEFVVGGLANATGVGTIGQGQG